MLVENKARLVPIIQHCNEPGHAFFNKGYFFFLSYYKKYQATVQKIHMSSFRKFRQKARVQ